MISRHCWGALIAACLSFLAPVLAEEKAPMSMDVGGEIVIGKDGHVRTFTVTTPVAPVVKTLVERSIQAWTFEPILRDGVAIEARTGYALRLTAVPVEKGYALRVNEAPSFHVPRKLLKQTMPLGSPDVLRNRQDVDVLAALRVDRDGNVAEAAVLAVQNSRKGEGVRNRRGYEQLVERTLREWKFEPAQPADTERFEGTIVFSFRGLSRDRLSAWHRPVFKDAKRIPWSDAPADASQLQDGQMLALDPAVKLKTPLAGTVL